MSLDEPRNPRHAAMVENPDDTAWLRMARRQEAAEAVARHREAMELVEFESVEAEEARWSYRMERSSVERERVHYDGHPAWGIPS